VSSVEIRVPDLGDFSDVDVIELHVAAGDVLSREDPLITIETDKATMDVPAPQAGKVESLAVSVGDKVSTGDLILTLAADDAATAAAPSDSAGSGAVQSDAAGREDAVPGRTARAAPAAARDIPRAPGAATEKAAPKNAAAEPRGGSRGGSKLVVLGSGPGGYTAAFRAADLGLLERRVHPVEGIAACRACDRGVA
jgi:dihydrolipoamide dehydrogenase